MANRILFWDVLSCLFLGVLGRVIQQCVVWNSKGRRRVGMEKVKLELGNEVFQLKVVRACLEEWVESLGMEIKGGWKWKIKGYCKVRFGQEVGGPETLGFEQV